MPWENWYKLPSFSTCDCVVSVKRICLSNATTKVWTPWLMFNRLISFRLQLLHSEYEHGRGRQAGRYNQDCRLLHYKFFCKFIVVFSTADLFDSSWKLFVSNFCTIQKIQRYRCTTSIVYLDFRRLVKNFPSCFTMASICAFTWSESHCAIVDPNSTFSVSEITIVLNWTWVIARLDLLCIASPRFLARFAVTVLTCLRCPNVRNVFAPRSTRSVRHMPPYNPQKFWF